MGLRYPRCGWYDTCRLAPECNAIYQCEGERPKCYGSATSTSERGNWPNTESTGSVAFTDALNKAVRDAKQRAKK